MKMSPLDAWHKLFSLSSSDWQRIPEDVRIALDLDSRLGICAGMLCTYPAYTGTTRFVNRLNSIAEGSK